MRRTHTFIGGLRYVNHRVLPYIKDRHNRKYSYENSYKSLGSVYRDVMGNDYIEVTKWGKDKVIIDTRHIVSIEKW